MLISSAGGQAVDYPKVWVASWQDLRWRAGIGSPKGKNFVRCHENVDKFYFIVIQYIAVNVMGPVKRKGRTMLKVLQMEKPTEVPDQKTDQAHHEALISAVAHQQDKSAFEALFLRFGPRIKGMMLGSGASEDLAEDLMQEVMLTVWRKANLYASERGTVSTWVFTIARNARIDRLRRQPVQPFVDVETVSIASDAPSAEAEMISGQHGEIVRAALQKLPQEQRDVIDLAFNQFMPQSEIAKKLDLPIGTVKSRTRLAYKKLKGNLEDLR